ncbi:hypothetical protein AM499_13635 [Bacillus sp. FJAT-22090]|nr:hypothetical protein AM499_13635 [Bacillus sp. FJAT-22090]
MRRPCILDSTHLKASANKRKYGKKLVRKETRAYVEKLQEELNLDREENGKTRCPRICLQSDQFI